MNTPLRRKSTNTVTAAAAALLGLVSALSLAPGCAGKDSSSFGPNGPSSDGVELEAPMKSAPESSGRLGTRSYGGDRYSGGGESRDATAAMDAAEEPVAQSAAGDEYAPKDYDDASARRHKPGLGTEYGERRWSQVRSVSFKRGNPRSPDAVLSMRYNDSQGVRELARMRGSGFRASAVSEAGPFRMTLMDSSGRSLEGAVIGGESYAVGETGQRYTIGIENDSGARYEVLATVDGLDVIDGEHGSFDKRGYVVEPFTSFVIEGWRTSDQSVAAFRFSSIEESYAERTGRGRNIGVIGAAFFRERARPDYYELNRRDHADPFPGR